MVDNGNGDNKDKFLHERFGLGRPHFHASSHLKTEVTVFFF